MTAFAILDEAPVASAPLQTAPVSVALTNGNTLSYWNDFANIHFGPNGGQVGSLRGQLYDADGNEIAEQFWLNHSGYAPRDAQVVALTGGGFAASWFTYNPTDPADPSITHIAMRIFDAGAVPQSIEFVANGVTAGMQTTFDLLALDNGNIAVLYENYSGSQGLLARIFDPLGNPLASDAVLGGPETGRIYDDAEVLPGGGFIVTWSELVGGKYDVRAQVFDDSGAAVGGAFTINQTTSRHESTASLTSLTDGRLLAAWKAEDRFNNITPDNQTFGRFINAEGAPVGDEFVLSEEADKGAIVTALTDGGFAIAWDEFIFDNPNNASVFNIDLGIFQWISARRFDANGVADGADFQWEVPGRGLDSPIGHQIVLADLDETPDGRLALSWTDYEFFTAANGTGTLINSSAFVRFIDFGPDNAAPVIAWNGGGITSQIVLAEDVPTIDGPLIFEHDFGRVTVSDINGNRLAFTLSGEDAALFTLDPVSGRLLLNQRVDFDDPSDQGRDNTYRVTIAVSDGTASDTQDFVLTVTNIVEGVLRQGGSGKDKLTGSADHDVINGLGANDTLKGLAGNDLIDGGDGNDSIDGGAGADTMTGGAGNDTFTVDNALDRVIEANAGGTDQVNATISYTLGDHVEKLALKGSDTINGSGNALANTITGNAANNRLDGFAGKDTLIGGIGDDRLYGGSGSDILTGGSGADSFVFDTLETSAAKDTIKDFAHLADKLLLENAVFASLVEGSLAADALGFGTAATTADHRLIYNQAKGTLFYDADGVGGAAQIQIAVLTNLPTLDAADFLIV